MKENLKNFGISLLTDAAFGLIASFFVRIILKILPTLLESILPPILYNAEQWLKIINALGFWQVFAILFGVRFIIAYVTGNYRFNPVLSLNNKLLKKLEM